MSGIATRPSAAIARNPVIIGRISEDGGMPSAVNVHCSATIVAISSVSMAPPNSQLRTIRMRSVAHATGSADACFIDGVLPTDYRLTIYHLSFFGKSRFARRIVRIGRNRTSVGGLDFQFTDRGPPVIPPGPAVRKRFGRDAGKPLTALGHSKIKAAFQGSGSGWARSSGAVGRRQSRPRSLSSTYAHARAVSSAQLSSAQLSSAQLSSAQLSSAQLSPVPCRATLP